MTRITQKMLDFQLEVLNDHSKCRYQIGSSYGHMNLELCSMECTGIKSISMGNTKSELYYQLLTLNSIHSEERTNKVDYVKNCTHLDTFNINHFEGEKKDVSHIYKNPKGENICLCCKKVVSEAVSIESHKSRSSDELRKLRIDN